MSDPTAPPASLPSRPSGPDAPEHPPGAVRRAPVEAPRLRPFARFGVVAGWGCRRLVRTRKVRWIAFLVLGVGVLAGLSISGSRDPAHELWTFLGTPVLGVCVPLIALALAAGGFGEEVSEQTLVFHLVRPVSRTTLYLARFAAGLLPAIAASCALSMIAIVVSGVGVSPTTIGVAALAATVGTTVVGAVYYALAALFRRGLVAGLLYTFVVEGFFQFVPGAVQKLALTHHVRSLFHRSADADLASLSKRVAAEIVPRPPVLQVRSLKDLVTPEPWSSTSNALLVCAIVTLVALVVGARTVRRRDFALKD